MNRAHDAKRDAMRTRIEALTAQIARIEEEQRQPLDDDFAEQVAAREDDEPLDAIERAALAEIDQTRLALARIDAGTYGLCTACGGAIGEARLRALPAAALCIACASAAAPRHPAGR